MTSNKEILEQTRMEFNIEAREWEYLCFEGFYVPEICEFAMDKARQAGKSERDKELATNIRFQTELAKENARLREIKQEKDTILLAKEMHIIILNKENKRLREGIERLIIYSEDFGVDNVFVGETITLGEYLKKLLSKGDD